MESISILISVILVAVLIIAILIRIIVRLKEQQNELISRKQSLSTKYGRISEQFMPFIEDYPYDPNCFRFIGDPIDGVQFNEDKIVFMEFKASGAKMSSRQKKIRQLVKEGKVTFEEFRIGINN